MPRPIEPVAVTASATPWPVVLKRTVLAMAGIVCVIVGYVGLLLPGIPTVGPLMLASFFFTKSCPYLEKKLIRNRFFAKVLPYMDGQVEMPRQAKLISIGLMWTSISFSVWVMSGSAMGQFWLPLLTILAGVIGTFFIWHFGKKKNA